MEGKQITDAREKQVDYINKAYSSIRERFTVDADFKALLSLVDGGRGRSIIATPVQLFIDDAISGRSVSEGHPYYKRCSLYNRDIPKTISNRIVHIKDFKKNGILTPVEILINNLGIVLVHGHTRINYAFYAKLPTLKVDICLCTEDLVEIKSFLDRQYPSRKNVTYQPIASPAFAFHRILNNQLPIKVGAIATRIKGGSSFIDFGCHLGYATREMNRLGVKGFGVEYQERYISMARTIEAVGERQAWIKHQRIEDYVARNDPISGHVPIFLSVIHHFLKTPHGLEVFTGKIIPWIQRNCPQAFVEHHYEDHYPVKNDCDAVGFWQSHGFRAERIDYSPDGKYWLNRSLFELSRSV